MDSSGLYVPQTMVGENFPIYGAQWRRGVVVTNTAQLHSTKPNSGSAQVQILIMKCRVS